ncbi:GNAT family N-acetyltransferase [bacterium]|nr:GNAT family N-acetyltransferase [bacterium]
MNPDNYRLIPLSEEYFSRLYTWTATEKQQDHYTCRPCQTHISEKEYVDKMRRMICSPDGSCYVLVAANDDKEPLGKIRSFDYNPRNHSAEFGYYLPEQNRNKGLGSIMLQQFVGLSFGDRKYNLNKLYATTSSSNIPSVSLLEKCGFAMDGRQREHYWIEGKRYDQLIYSILRSEWDAANPA